MKHLFWKYCIHLLHQFVMSFFDYFHLMNILHLILFVLTHSKHNHFLLICTPAFIFLNQKENFKALLVFQSTFLYYCHLKVKRNIIFNEFVTFFLETNFMFPSIYLSLWPCKARGLVKLNSTTLTLAAPFSVASLFQNMWTKTIYPPVSVTCLHLYTCRS